MTNPHRLIALTAIRPLLNVTDADFARICDFVFDAAHWMIGGERPLHHLLAVHGPSGSGKSTTAQAIIDLFPIIASADPILGRHPKTTLRNIFAAARRRPLILSEDLPALRLLVSVGETKDVESLVFRQAAMIIEMRSRDDHDSMSQPHTQRQKLIPWARAGLWAQIAAELLPGTSLSGRSPGDEL